MAAIAREQVIDLIEDLPAESLGEVVRFIEFLRFRSARDAGAPVTMGGDPPYPPAQPVTMGGDPPYPPAQPVTMGGDPPYPPAQPVTMGGDPPYPPAQPVDTHPPAEAPLLAIVHRRLPPEDQRRLSALRALKEERALTPEEQAELLSYVERVEREDAERAQALLDLARLRGVPLGALLTDLGLSTGG